MIFYLRFITIILVYIFSIAFGLSQKSLESLAQNQNPELVGDKNQITRLEFAKFLLHKCKVYIEYDGNFQAGIEICKYSILISEELLNFAQINDNIDKKEYYNFIAKIAKAHQLIGQYKEALDLYKILTSLLARNPDLKSSSLQIDKLSLLKSIGSIYGITGQYQKQLNTYKQLPENEKNLKQLKNYLIAEVYTNLGQYQKAIEVYNLLLMDDELYVLTLQKLGQNYIYLGQYQEAIRYSNRALKLAERIGNSQVQASSFVNIAESYSFLNQPKRSLEAFQRALKISSRLSDLSSEGRIISKIGDVYKKKGDFNEALRFYRQGLAIQIEGGDRPSEGSTLSNIGSLLLKKQPELAIVFYKQAVNTYESIRKDIKGLSKEEKESYLSTIAQTYRNLADLLLKQGRILEAQQVLELLKVEEIRAYTRNTRAIDDTNGIATNKTETKTIDKHSSLIALGLRVDECEQKKCPQLGQLIQQREIIAAEYEQTAKALIREIRDRKSDDDQFFDPRKVAKMNEIVSAQPNTVLIYPLILKDKIWVLWASKGGITKSIEVPNVGLEKVSSNVLKLRNLLQSPNNLPELQETSKQLYDWLIPAELQAELNANKIEHLIFAPDSVTRYIPMGVLFDGKKYLIENYTIATIISADLTNTTARLPNSAKSTSILAAGLSQSISGFSPLPNVLTEINAIVRTADNPNNGIYDGVKLLDRTFTRESLRDNLGNHAIAHIATHGKFVSGDADKSFLVLGDGKTLPIPEIEKFRGLEKLHLVVLSACQTALGGTNGDGTEIAGISYYFLNTGAKAVIASLWEVSDDSTSLLMQQFYNNLAKSATSAPITKAEAMRQAQLSLLQKQITAKDSIQRGTLAVVYQAGAKPTDNYSHPYYWSPFILIGNGW